ncbi:TraR/DksA C4-type zinc finger protein [Alkalicoccobacillus porphyridii]|uniref:Zinc finger DksA/TraR C4-type domain-containing protein n=1 Tax=Alkalicoccobacillus porphyridii TaxID=2597270 RepID=A0A553ZY17_9BACI|nr:TraR/DksA C4-type zinc finger protein [Alkalicoccobacillus porphyridii]TSB46342.1 hypothetical protein FN960_11065 [Alkalicoccobacillus porphyridii]
MRDFTDIKNQLLQQRDLLKKRLDKHQKMEKMQAVSASTGELSQYDNHPADSGSELYEREKDMALYAQVRHEYDEVQRALTKLNEGTYGVCEKTGEDIPLERLQANPIARTASASSQTPNAEYRPVEEDVLGGFGKYNYDQDKRETEFDGEDAYQAVARFNEQDLTYEDQVSEDEERIGSVEEYEEFLSTDMHGYQGEESIRTQHNRAYKHYTDEIDEEE